MTPRGPPPTCGIYQGDALDVLKTLEDRSIQCCVTSPPYWGLRDYGNENQIGLEKTPQEYIQKLVNIFHEVRRVLKKDGTCWIVIGDSYAGSGCGSNDYREPGSSMSKSDKKYQGQKPGSPHGYKPKDLIGIPWMLAFALRDDGWYLRQEIIWSKQNPMPESVKDRCTKSHENIFLLSKSKKYYFDNVAIQETAVNAPGRGGFGSSTGKMNTNKLAHTNKVGKAWDKKYAGGGTSFKGHRGCFKKDGTPICGIMRNKRSVWTVPTQPFKAAHFAAFPEKLITPMILAGCPEGGIVLDPFFGAGTIGVVCKKLNRNYIGIELNLSYIKMAEKRLFEVPVRML